MKRYFFVIGLLVIAMIVAALYSPVSAIPVETYLRSRTFVLSGSASPQIARSTLSDRQGLNELRPFRPTAAPTPLPTPVTPTDVATGWIIPPPTPQKVVSQPAVSRSIAHLLIMPVSGTITTYFSSSHPAVDISNRCGKGVGTSAAGVVTWVGWRNNGGGMVVEINHGWGRTSYNHLSGYTVRAGQTVKAGQQIATIGSSGNSTGCHVHWSLVVGGRFVNPLAYLK